MIRFDIGDKVRRTGTSCGGAEKGEIYTVENTNPFRLVELDWNGFETCFFELVTAAPTATATVPTRDPITVETADSYAVTLKSVGGVAIYEAGCFAGNFAEATARVKGRAAYQAALDYLKHMADSYGYLEAPAEPKLVADEDNGIFLWKNSKGEQLVKLENHHGTLTLLACDQEGNKLSLGNLAFLQGDGLSLADGISPSVRVPTKDGTLKVSV